MKWLMRTHLQRVPLVLAILVMGACRVTGEDNTEAQLQTLFSAAFSEDSIAFVDISDDGKHILAGDAVEKIRYWNLNARDRPIEINFDSELIALNFASRDNQVFFANRVGQTRLLDNSLKAILSEYKFPQPSRFSRISRDLELIAYGEYIFYRNRNELSPSTVGHAGQSSLQLSNQNFIVTSGFHDERVVVRRNDGATIADWRLENPVTTSAISADGDFVVASTENGDCFLWHVPTGKLAQRCDNAEAANTIHFDALGKYFILIMEDAITAYQLEPFKKLFSTDVNSNITSSFLAENNWLAIGTDASDIVLVDVVQGKHIGALKLDKGKITSIDVNAAARLLLLGTDDGNIKLYRVS